MNPASALGFARAAGRLKSGDGASEQALRRGAARLVVLAEDAGANTVRRFERMAKEQEVPVLRWGNKAQLGAWIGERPRAVVAVCDPHFAAMFMKAVAGSGKQLR